MSIQRYRKKPVEIEAIPVRDALRHASESWDKLPAWLRDAYERGQILFLADRIRIQTPEGRMTALLDDFVIQGVQGELYPCKPDIFAATYEAV